MAHGIYALYQKATDHYDLMVCVRDNESGCVVGYKSLVTGKLISPKPDDLSVLVNLPDAVSGEKSGEENITSRPDDPKVAKRPNWRKTSGMIMPI